MPRAFSILFQLIIFNLGYAWILSTKAILAETTNLSAFDLGKDATIHDPESLFFLAQVTPDNSSINTQVNQNGNVAEVTGGQTKEGNLFHSFDRFSVPIGNEAFFNNADNISNIFGRVTGGNISNIDGAIRANGSANLFLINPAGIIFGENASLNIGGSFLGSTAESIIFADGTVLNTNTAAEPLITISVPVGLQLGQNSAEIEVSGNGHNLSVADPLFSPIIFGEELGIRVKPNRTLALLGGGITIDGGVVAAPGGKIELGSVAEGTVDLNLSNSQLSLSYENVTAFDNVELRSQSLVDASGTELIPGGQLQVRGGQLSLNDGSLLLVQNQADRSAGAININTSESVTVSGTNDDSTIRSSIVNETIGTGNGGDLNITTSQLTVDFGAAIVAKTLQPGNAIGGDVKINAAESVRVIGSSNINPSVTSSIAAASFGSGDGGNNTIVTNFLSAISGGTIVATTLGTGNGGELNITANAIEVIGIEPNIFAASALTASTLSEGNAGNLTISTSTLDVLAGGRVDSSTIASGDAGNLKITATDSITVDGTVPGPLNPSLIVSAANIVDRSLQEILQLPPVPSGNAGSVFVTTQDLQITNRGEISVINNGSGDGGRLEIDANTISLDRQGVITAATESGEGGNISIDADNAIWRGRSLTTTTAAGSGNGGNIIINADTVVTLDGSRVTADAFTGMGGNVEINARGLIICESCQISASSELGIDGVVDIETLESTTIDSLELLQQPTQPQEEVAVACPIGRAVAPSHLTIVGRGGLPSRPQQTLDARSLIEFNTTNNSATHKQLPVATQKALPRPARNWYKNEQGTVVLTAQSTIPSSNLNSTPVSCRIPQTWLDFIK